MRKALDAAQLSERNVVWPVVEKMAKQHDVEIRQPAVALEVKDPKGLINDYAKSDFKAEISCFEGLVTRMEHDMPQLQSQANAWATGDIEPLRKLSTDSPEQRCVDVLMGTPRLASMLEDARRKFRLELLLAMEGALQRNSGTLAVVSIRELMAKDGVLQRTAAARLPGHRAGIGAGVDQVGLDSAECPAITIGGLHALETRIFGCRGNYRCRRHSPRHKPHSPHAIARAWKASSIATWMRSTANKPSMVPLSPNVRFTEDGQRLLIGDGLWNTMKGKGKYRLFVTDVPAGEVAFLGTIQEDHRDADKFNGSLIALRLRVHERPDHRGRADRGALPMRATNNRTYDNLEAMGTQSAVPAGGAGQRAHVARRPDGPGQQVLLRHAEE